MHLERGACKFLVHKLFKKPLEKKTRNENTYINIGIKFKPFE